MAGDLHDVFLLVLVLVLLLALALVLVLVVLLLLLRRRGGRAPHDAAPARAPGPAAPLPRDLSLVLQRGTDSLQGVHARVSRPARR